MLSLFTVGVVPGSESLSFPFSVIIVVPFSSTSSAIHATFVNIWFAPIASTLHSISIVSDFKSVPLNASKLFVPVFVNVNLFVPSS